jgi:hypothetical protein
LGVGEDLMGRASTIQNAMNGGELSPLMLGRQDVSKYGSSLLTCLNGIPLAQGAWTRRPGTLFLTQARHHDKVARLFPFQFSVTQTYMLEFGAAYIRFFTGNGILTKTAQNVTTISKANPAVLTYNGADSYANGERVFVSGVVGMTQVNNREFVVTNVDTGANTFELYDSNGAAVDSSGYGTYSSGGTVGEILEITTSFTEADIPSIRVVQSADVLYILHPSYAPQKLVRTSALVWTLSTIAFTDGPYDNLNITTTTLTPSAATGSVTLTASSPTGINSNTGFQATDVGRLIRIQEGSTWGYGEVTAVSTTVACTFTVFSTLTNTNAKTNWRLGVWSNTTGFPADGTFFEDRLVLGGARSFPQRWDASKSGNYESYAPSSAGGTIANDNAIAFTLNSSDVNAIRWIRDNEKGLLVGTSRGEWLCKASALGEALTPTNVSGKPSTKHGSAAIAPVQAGKALLFVQRAARKLRELVFVFEADGFKAPDMTMLAEHITSPSMTEITYQEQPQNVLWAVRSDGVLLGFTYERDQEVTAWHRHELGGQSNAAGDEIPVVESMAIVPAPDGSRDELYLIVKRYINGGVKRYVELMTKIWESEDVQADAFHVDGGWTITNDPAAATVTGLWHLEGETVGVYADGAKHPDVTITNGIATLNYAASVVTLGYYYNSDGQTMPIDAGAQDGSAQGKVKRIARIGFWLMDTLGLKYGRSDSTLTEILFRQWGDPHGVATDLFTGVVRQRFEGDYDRLGQVYWRADGPFPASVLAVMVQVTTADDS